jgi:hypothetical protein
MTAKPNPEVVAMDAALKALSDLESAEQKRVLAWLVEKLNLSGFAPLGSQSPQTSTQLGTQQAAGTAGMPSAKQFMAQKKPKTDAERITCLAYYLTHYRKIEKFKTKELTDLNKEAAGAPFSNAAVAVSNAARDSYFAPAGGGLKQITTRGEAVVEALPDREKVKAALEELPARRRKPSKNKSHRTR